MCLGDGRTLVPYFRRGPGYGDQLDVTADGAGCRPHSWWVIPAHFRPSPRSVPFVAEIIKLRTEVAFLRERLEFYRLGEDIDNG